MQKPKATYLYRVKYLCWIFNAKTKWSCQCIGTRYVRLLTRTTSSLMWSSILILVFFSVMTRSYQAVSHPPCSAVTGSIRWNRTEAMTVPVYLRQIIDGTVLRKTSNTTSRTRNHSEEVLFSNKTTMDEWESLHRALRFSWCTMGCPELGNAVMNDECYIDSCWKT